MRPILLYILPCFRCQSCILASLHVSLPRCPRRFSSSVAKTVSFDLLASLPDSTFCVAFCLCLARILVWRPSLCISYSFGIHKMSIHISSLRRSQSYLFDLL